MRVVALLRGVNVGGSNRLKMADLRAAVESLGLTDVETYLQSGNVVFTAPRSRSELGEAISARLRETCGIDVRVLTRTGAEMASIVAANPYQRDDPTKVVVVFLPDAGAPPDLDLDAFAPEGLTIHGRELYLDLPFGQGRSRLAAALAKLDDGASTTRNWRTVLALSEMSASSAD
ncbi:MAG: DUF1697 domain-containing protein [Acidimicrobiales bacterium]